MKSSLRLLPSSCRTIAPAFGFGMQQYSIGLGEIEMQMRSVFVSSLHSARLASMIALLYTVVASPAALAASVTVIESFGSTSLVQVGNNFYFYPVGGSSGPLLKYNGSAVALGQYPVSFIGAEKTASGFQIALRVIGADQYIVWNTDRDGNVVSNATGGVIVSGSSSLLKSLEVSFRQDLNGDGVVGAGPGGGSARPTVAFSATPTNIAPGKASVMTWSSTNATSCTASGGWNGTKATSGTLAASPPTTTTYGLTCTGSGGTSPTATTTVTVNAGPAAVSGVCGPANGTTASTKPSTNLCAAGPSSSIAGSGPWTWSCGGSNGGATVSCSASAGAGGSTPPAPGPVAGNCSLQLGGAAIFCETFDKKNPGIPSRTGDLDPHVWGVSRAGNFFNVGQGQYNGWAATQLQTCNGMITVTAPSDVVICNGQLREASNDNPTGAYDAGGVTLLALYPKQPFDFAGRTGTVSFDISNDTHGIHAAWPEFWMTNLPIPAPFFHPASQHLALPEHGFGIRFSSPATAGQYGDCPNSNNLNKKRWTVDSAIVIRNYVMDDTFVPDASGVRTSMSVQKLDCVVAPADNSGITNHIELKISQNQIDIYATDAGVAPSPSTLKHLAVITNANLSFTRGLIWLQDVHYNADKAEAGPNIPSQKQHTFVWDNVAFDGPFTYRDFSYDALDANRPAVGNTVNLGKVSSANQTASWDVLNMPANPKAASVRVLFNFYQESPSKIVNVIVNGHAHSTPWPYPETEGFRMRTLAVTIPITDLVSGTNVVQIGADHDMITSNVNIVLVNVPGGVPVLPGSNNAYPGGSASTQ